jgi:hypothetical protein
MYKASTFGMEGTSPCATERALGFVTTIRYRKDRETIATRTMIIYSIIRYPWGRELLTPSKIKADAAAITAPAHSGSLNTRLKPLYRKMGIHTWLVKLTLCDK